MNFVGGMAHKVVRNKEIDADIFCWAVISTVIEVMNVQASK